MQKVLPDYTLLIISISSPLKLGIYGSGKLIKEVKSDQKTSDILLYLISKIMEEYPLRSIIYTRGPGSYMSIKLTYIILKSLEIVRDIPFYGCSAFTLNNEKPIKAMGNLYFVKDKDNIITQKYNEPIAQIFMLPTTLDKIIVDDISTPNYVIQAV